MANLQLERKRVKQSTEVSNNCEFDDDYQSGSISKFKQFLNDKKSVEYIGGYEFETTQYGMLKQKNIQSFNYDEKYLDKQSTNLEMAYLRLGWLCAHAETPGSPYEWLKECRVLELGPGTGVFFDIMKKHVLSMDGYDVAKSPYSTVTLDEVYSRKWDLVVGFDVLEHFHEIDDLWKIDFRIGYFSSPSPPKDGVTASWRHFKPNEHTTIFDWKQFVHWVKDHKYQTLKVSNHEDLIRKRWDEKQENIYSYLIKRIDYK